MKKCRYIIAGKDFFKFLVFAVILCTPACYIALLMGCPVFVIRASVSGYKRCLNTHVIIAMI